jgi:ATP-dependent metalloprotease
MYGEQGISGGAGGSGHGSDLAVATAGALQLVTQHGLGPEHDLFWSDTASDSQVRQAQEILRASYRSVLTKVWQHKDKLQRLADALVEHQELTGDEVRSLIGAMEDITTVDITPRTLAALPIHVP